MASARGASALWIAILTGASVVTTLALACATPFTALAALAATRMDRRDGIALMLVVWAASQAVGFCMLGYPRDPSTFAWGLALGVAAVAAVIVARGVADRAGMLHPALVLALAYLAATAGFKLVVLLASLGLGGVGTALSPAVLLNQLVRNGAMLVGLVALHRLAVAAGLPVPVRRPMPC